MPLYCIHRETFGNCRFHVFERDFKYGEGKRGQGQPVHCSHGNVEIDCKFCTTSAAWAIVKDGKGMRESGHAMALSWARGALGLEDQREVSATRAPHDPEHDINDD
jgi:hypothetical protein